MSPAYAEDIFLAEYLYVFAGFCRDGNGFSVVFYGVLAVKIGNDFGIFEFVVLPFAVDGYAAFGANSSEFSVVHEIGNAGENFDFVIVRLNQHFAECRRGAEVAVNLEDVRRVQVEEVGRGRVAQKALDVFAYARGVFEFCQEYQRPRTAPTGVTASVVEAYFQRFFHRAEQVGRVVFVDEASGIDA